MVAVMVELKVGKMVGLWADEKATMRAALKVSLWEGHLVEKMDKKLVALMAGLTESGVAGQWGRKWVGTMVNTWADVMAGTMVGRRAAKKGVM